MTKNDKENIIEMKSRLKTKKQMIKSNELVNMASNVITKMMTKGLSPEEARMFDNFFAEARGEKIDQPNWSDSDRITQTLQTLYNLGFEEGAIKESKRLNNLLSKYQKLIDKLTKDLDNALKVETNGTTR
jgi:hypothetical protein